MAYSSGLLNKRVTILNRAAATAGQWGIDGRGIEWKEAGQVWASVDWAKGKSALNAGAIDAYGVVMVRMRWNGIVNLRSRVKTSEGAVYQILPETFREDKAANTIQFAAQQVID